MKFEAQPQKRRRRANEKGPPTHIYTTDYTSSWTKEGSLQESPLSSDVWRRHTTGLWHKPWSFFKGTTYLSLTATSSVAKICGFWNHWLLKFVAFCGKFTSLKLGLPRNLSLKNGHLADFSKSLAALLHLPIEYLPNQRWSRHYNFFNVWSVIIF